MDFFRAFIKAKALIKSLKVADQWRAEVWWCPGRLLDCTVYPLQNSGSEQQHVVVIVSGYTLFATS